jgi:phage tail sheath protein FI
MPTFLHPGVYVQEVPSGARPIEAVGTATAAFVGFTTRGPLAEPILITRRQDYDDIFGGIQPGVQPDGESSDSPLDDALGHAVNAFFLNGGTTAYVVRLARQPSSASASFPPSADETTPDPERSLTVEAANPGTWANDLRVRVSAQEVPEGRYTLEVGREVQRGSSRVFQALERFTDVSFEQATASFIASRVNHDSRLITLSVGEDFESSALNLASPADFVELTLSGGTNGTLPNADDYAGVFDQFLKIRDINMICLPGRWWGSTDDAIRARDEAIINAAISHCETIQNRMVLVDIADQELSDATAVSNLELPTSTYAVTYYPWVRVSNPFFDPETNPGSSPVVSVQPSGFAAGIWAKIDSRRGVWKAPAGVETNLLGVAGLSYLVEDAEQDFLNPAGINAFRTLPSFGTVVWGSRTLATRRDPEWRYVPVRRTALFIEESIRNGIKFAVFEGNDQRLWATLRSTVNAFMDSLFRAGAFQGNSAAAAYFVRCGLGDTMTQADIDAGRVIVLVGFAPLKPAEFVILRIQQIAGQ